MNNEQLIPVEDDVIDLGAASEITQGVWDPMLKENHIMPQSRDF